MSTFPDEERERAQRRFVWLQIVRIGSIAAVLTGLAIARGVLEANWWLGAGLAVAGVIGFFFAPPLLARHFKARDTHLPDRMDRP